MNNDNHLKCYYQNLIQSSISDASVKLMQSQSQLSTKIKHSTSYARCRKLCKEFKKRNQIIFSDSTNNPIWTSSNIVQHTMILDMIHLGCGTPNVLAPRLEM